MKRAKKFLTLLLTLTMLLSLSLTAFAADSPAGPAPLPDPTTDEVPSITIKGVLEGNTYTVYKIFDLTYTPADETAGTEASYSYSISKKIGTGDSAKVNPLYDYIKTMTIDRSGTNVTVFNLSKSGDDNISYVSLNTDGFSGTVSDDGEIVKEIAKTLMAYINNYNANPDNATNKIEFVQQIDKLKTEGENTSNIYPNGADITVVSEQVTKPGTGSPVTQYNLNFNKLDLGYYLIDTSAGTMLGLTSTAPNAVINAKNLLPGIEKKVFTHGSGKWEDQNSKGIGETVTFRTTITVEAGAKNYVVYDNMSDGLKFQHITKIYYGNGAPSLAKATIYTYNATNPECVDLQNRFTFKAATNTETIEYADTQMDFMLTFDDAEFLETVYNTQNEAGMDHCIYIEYEAVVTKDAQIGKDGNNTNDVWLTYGDNNVLVGKDQTKTYIFGFDVVKTDGTGKLLEGAKFELYEDQECTKQINLVKGEVKDGIQTYRVATKEESEAPDFQSAVIEAGHVRIEGVGAAFTEIKAGTQQPRTYYLKETDAPTGYNKLAEPTPIGIDGSTDFHATLDSNKTYQGGGWQIKNNKGNELPSTGGIGTTIFYVVGSVLLVGAGVLLVTKRRMNADK